MTISDDQLLSYVVERDIDLVFVQLIQTSPEFRDWFIDQIDFEQSVDEFLGVRHSVTTDTGESDVEVGFKTVDGENLLVLVENKIDASMQDRQVERYFERGENYLSNDEWDAFKVCLIAPKNYVSESKRRAFDTVVVYEEIIDETESIDHDGSEFFSEVFQQSLAKRIPADNSDLTSTIRQRILSKLDELSGVRIYQTSKTQVRLESTHENHPSVVLYNAYVPGRYDGNKTIVRINLTGRDDAPKEERELLRPLFLEDLPIPDGFEPTDRSMDIIRKEIDRSNFASRNEYIDCIVTELLGLIEFYYPLLVKEAPLE